VALFGKTYPENYHIDDWEHPWLPLPVRLLNAIPDSVARRFTALEENRLFDLARRETGLTDFGDEDFLVPFRILLQDLNTYDHFTVMGRITAQTILHQQLCARLCLQDKIKRSPEIQQQRIDRPLIIAGLPRTGTTHLHNLLSRVNRMRYMPLWQTLNPVAPPLGKSDHRRKVADLSVNATRYIIPLFHRMHEMVTDEPHEELTLCALGYRSFFFEGAFQVPNYRKWYAGNPQEKGYAYLKQTLQILQTETAPGNKTADARWVLKSPQHVDQLPTILKVFPDAKLILTHRDPARAVLSMVTMILYTSRHVYKPVRLREEAHAWVDRLEKMLRDSQQQALLLPKERVMNVSFDDFMKDPKDTIAQVLAFAELEYDDISRQAVEAHLQSHTRDRYGKIDYRFEDIGISEGELKERFSFYKY